MTSKAKLQPPTVRCNSCPYWGQENLVNDEDGLVYSSCRVELPRAQLASARFKSGKIVGLVATQGWTRPDYWCGRHPSMSLVAAVLLPTTPPALASEIVADGGTVENK